MTSPALEVTGLRKVFRVAEPASGFAARLKALFSPTWREVVAVKDIDLRVEEGELIAFIGPNGAGKSTTIKMLTGILHPTAGQVRVLGVVPWEQRSELARRIGTVFGQRSQLWYHLPPRDTFELLSHVYEISRADYRQRVGDLVERFEIGEFYDIPVRKLSLGQRMRCELVASLLHRPRVLFLDEPTIGLDVLARARVRDLLLELNRQEGITTFLTSHEADDIEEICRRVVIVNRGEMVLDIPVKELKHRFLQVKVIDLRLRELADPPAVEGVRILKKKGHGLKLEVDTTAVPIERALSELFKTLSIADIVVSDPPLEEIIGAIYTGEQSVNPPIGTCAVRAELVEAPAGDALRQAQGELEPERHGD
ncbi:MAG: ATP-binding cassette domain-containing protein [Candidatus Wallbacteria bacterium]|nr:ATP-binding cassette domain-containing protein [Candidatus Wallbacteria bacterium]